MVKVSESHGENVEFRIENEEWKDSLIRFWFVRCLFRTWFFDLRIFLSLYLVFLIIYSIKFVSNEILLPAITRFEIPAIGRYFPVENMDDTLGMLGCFLLV